MSEKVESLNKITIKDLLPKGFKPADEVKDGSRDLFFIIGSVNEAQTKEGQYGPFVKFFGQFEAVRLSDGQKFSSAICILKEPWGSMLADKLEKLKAKEGHENDTAEFAFKIGVKPSDKPSKYEWVLTPVSDLERADPLQKVREIALKGIKALPAPKKDK